MIQPLVLFAISHPPKENIIRDERIKLTNPQPLKDYPEGFRLVEADIIVNNKTVHMTFTTNNFEWVRDSV